MRCRGQKVEEIGMIGNGVGGSRDDELCSLRGVFVCRTGLGDVMRSIDLSHSLNPPSAATRPSPDTTPYSNRPFSDPMQGPVHYWASGPVPLFIAATRELDSHPLPYPSESTLHDGAS